MGIRSLSVTFCMMCLLLPRWSELSAGQFEQLTYEKSEEKDNPGVIITKSEDSATMIKIPENIAGLPVIGMAPGAFSGHPSLESVTIPETVSSISPNAFYGCESLLEVTLPDSLRSIGSFAFAHCVRLPSIQLNEGLNHIGRSAFIGCKELKELRIPKSIEDPSQIEETAFAHCRSLEMLVIAEAFCTRRQASIMGIDEIYPWGFVEHDDADSNAAKPTSAYSVSKQNPSIQLAPVIMVQGHEGALKTIEIAESPEGPWKFWMTVSATQEGVAITDLDGQAHKRFYRVRD